MRLLVCLSLLTLLCSQVIAQNPGCPDPQAFNYNPAATQNDGSCQYTTTVLSPNIVLDPLPAGLEESSGLIGVGGAHWTHNDSGDDPVLYRIDPISGLIEQEITLVNASNIDWEDIAQDIAWIYVGDFGNNNGTRTNLRIYRIAKDSIPASGNDTVFADTLNFNYPDQTDFSSRPQNHNFDCEALLAKGDSLYLFSKNWVDFKTRLYRLPKTPGTFTAELIDSFDVQTLITGADYNPETEQAVLIGYDDNGFNTKGFLWLLWDFQNGSLFSGNKRPFDYGSVAFAGQVEAIAYLDSFDIRITNEQITISPFTVTAKLHQWNTRSYVTNVMTTRVKNEMEAVTLYPNPVTLETRLLLPAAMGEMVEWEILDLMGTRILHRTGPYPGVNGILVGNEFASLPEGMYLVRIRLTNETGNLYSLRVGWSKK